MARKHIKQDPGYARWQRLSQMDLGERIYGA
jgi:hypothetical protein